MKVIGPKANAEIRSHCKSFTSEIPKLRKLATSQNLTGLANDTKWNELISYMRSIEPKGWVPKFRYNCIDTEYISNWDGEWWHHLPFPLISVRWLEIGYFEKNTELIDHSSEIKNLLVSIGFEFKQGKKAFRIFGYSPKDCTDFCEKENTSVQN